MIIRTAIVGLGSVNCHLLSILENKRDRLLADHDVEFLIVCLADSKGVAVNPDGYDPKTIRQLKQNGQGANEFSGFLANVKMSDVLNDIECDLVMEASPVNLKTGGPSLEVTKAALKLGISVVLANKAPLVLAFHELHQIAAENNAGLAFSATVCGGLPVINIGQRDMIAADITSLRGIFNSTSNFILDEMATGRSYDDALSETQRRGIAEADPSLDVDGWDTANKLSIIANSILGIKVTLDDIKVEGIADITTQMLEDERKRGNVIKLVAEAESGKLSVKPIVLPETDFLANCDGWEMAVEIHSDLYGIMYHKLWEREPVPTAASMLRDAVNIFAN